MTSASDRDELRRLMRQRRRALTPRERKAAAQGLARVVLRLRILQPGRRIAAYSASHGEIDLARVLTLARRRGCKLYLPVVTRIDRGTMEFVRFEPDRPLRRNRFGILEPELRANERIDVRQLDVVLLPLVAVDHHGSRVGSGAGFYDRRLRHLHGGRRWRRPRLIGVAYEFQRVPVIQSHPWDVPLDAVVTERTCHPVHRDTP